MKKIMFIILSTVLMVVLAGCQSPKSYLVVIHYNNGNHSLVKLGTEIAKPETPIYEGYTFEGWFVDGKPYTFEDTIKENLVVEAKWSKIIAVKEEFKINFHAGEHIVIDSIILLEGQAIGRLIPTKSGFYFDGWYKDEAFKTAIDLAKGVYENLDLYAKWVEQPTTDKEVKLTFVHNQDEVADTTQMVSINKKAKAYSPIREGYRFLGWCYNVDLSDVTPVTKLQNVVFGKDTVLYAKWELK